MTNHPMGKETQDSYIPAFNEQALVRNIALK